jgi:hypothetical protein
MAIIQQQRIRTKANLNLCNHTRNATVTRRDPSLDSSQATTTSAITTSLTGVETNVPTPLPLTAFVQRTPTVEAFAVPNSRAPSANYGAPPPALSHVVMAYPATSTTTTTGNNSICNRRTVVILVIMIVFASVGSSYCASGACRPPNNTTNSVNSSSNSNSGNTTTLQPSRSRTNREVAMAAFISNRTLTRHTRIGQQDRPEDFAVQWLANDDPWQLWPNDTLSQWRLLQRYSLLTLYFRQWTASSSIPTFDAQFSWYRQWPIIQDECTWLGVTCMPTVAAVGAGTNPSTTTNYKVREILLDSNNLHGTLSADLGLLTELVRFSVYNNSLTGRLPESIGQ